MSLIRGNRVELKNDEFVYSDTKETVKDHWKTKACGYCGLNFTKEGHDGCIGEIPNVMNACCGHGIENDAYIQFLDKSCIRGKNAVEMFEFDPEIKRF